MRLAWGSRLRCTLGNERPTDHENGTADLQHRAGLSENDYGQNERDDRVELHYGRSEIHARRLARSEVAVSAENEMQDASGRKRREGGGAQATEDLMSARKEC